MQVPDKNTINAERRNVDKPTLGWIEPARGGGIASIGLFRLDCMIIYLSKHPGLRSQEDKGIENIVYWKLF